MTTTSGDKTVRSAVFPLGKEWKAAGAVPLKTEVTYTNLGPLTTTFTPPASCTTDGPDYLNVYESGNPDTLTFSQPCALINAKAPGWLNCQPYGPAYSPLYEAWTSSNQFYVTYMSPGISCPSDYETATSFTLASSDLSTITGAYVLPTAATHVYCCPSGYFSSVGNCVSSVSTATSTSLCDALCVDQDTCGTPAPFSWNPQQQDVTVEDIVWPVYMIHQQSDVPSGGLSTTAKIAIGVVVPVVVLAAIIIGVLLFMRRKKRKERSYSNGKPMATREIQR